MKKPKLGTGLAGWIALAGTLGMVGLSGCGGPGAGSLEVIVIYPEASGLEEEDELRMSGYAIGTVKTLDLEKDGRIAVHIKILPKYREHVTEGSTFAIKKESLLSSDRYIEMKPGTGVAVAGGSGNGRDHAAA